MIGENENKGSWFKNLSVIPELLPECCIGCRHKNSAGDGYGLLVFCDKGIFMPVKKQTCKKMMRDG